MSTSTPARKFVPLSYLTDASTKDCVQVLADQWWIVDGKNNALFNRSGNPMCSDSLTTISHIRNSGYPELLIEHVPLVFLPIQFNAEFDYMLP